MKSADYPENVKFLPIRNHRKARLRKPAAACQKDAKESEALARRLVGLCIYPIGKPPLASH